MQPKISIVIPVYNVEKHLRECLDSVVNQTMQDIQIICVNDGSPDGSRAILQEYADKDTRIEIIDKSNGGLSSARNAAYPSIKGKYTLFVDSDDWLERDLCEKVYRKAEESNAPITLFFYHRGRRKQHASSSIPNDCVTPEEKSPFLRYTSACCKLLRSDFLLDNKLYFPEGFVFEDNLFHWQAVTLADKIAVVPEELYGYRRNSASITLAKGEHSLQVVLIFDKIREYLHESGYYAVYREHFIVRKLRAMHTHYRILPASLHQQYTAMVSNSLSEDEREFLRCTPQKLPRTTRLFYAMIDGGKADAVKYFFSEIPNLLERFLKRSIVMPLRTFLSNSSGG